MKETRVTISRGNRNVELDTFKEANLVIKAWISAMSNSGNVRPIQFHISFADGHECKGVYDSASARSKFTTLQKFVGL